MLKILSTTQIKKLDAHTVTHEPIASIDLMERACHAFVSWFTRTIDVTKRVGVVCGTGNNGGDGLGIARLLHEWNCDVKVWIVRGGNTESPDFTMNLDRLRGKVEIFEIVSESDQGLFADREILIDAIFGSGLSRPAEGLYAQAIRCINKTTAIRIAVDIPSGLLADSTSQGDVVQAHHTVSFQLPKLSFLLPENSACVGAWHVVDIGLDKKFIQDAATDYYLLERSDIQAMLKPRGKFSHKGTFGHALLIAGSYGKIGAAVLGAKAAMRSGLGLLNVHVPVCGYTILQMSVPEAMVSVDDSEKIISTLPDIHFDAIGIGPGIGTDRATVLAFTQLLKKSTKPLVIDADALNILSTNRELIHLLPKGSILTPHPKEFERLVGESKSNFDRLSKLKEFAVKTGTIVLLKGAHSAIATPEGKVFFNHTGNPGMATGGSGDVLTGLLTGLLAQGYTPVEAAIAAAWIHGLAADIAVQARGMEALIASDIIEFLPAAFVSIR